jgi:GDPmannose 4,6-dehydratase
MSHRALITGITGQDGAYLSRFLLAQGYEVHGLIRNKQAVLSRNLAPLADRLQLHEGDVVDDASLYRVLGEVRPREVYNLAARSFIPASFTQPLLTAET